MMRDMLKLNKAGHVVDRWVCDGFELDVRRNHQSSRATDRISQTRVGQQAANKHRARTSPVSEFIINAGIDRGHARGFGSRGKSGFALSPEQMASDTGLGSLWY